MGFLLLTLALAALTLLSQFLPPDPALLERAGSIFDAETVSRGRDYAGERRWFYWGGQWIEWLLLAALVWSPLGTRVITSLCRGPWFVSLWLLGLFYLIALDTLSLPLALGGYYHRQAWGMSRQPLGEYLQQHYLQLAVYAVTAGLPLTGFYFLLRRFPRTWWLLSAAGAMAFAVLAAFLLPIVVAPLFNTFTPLRETKWRDQEPAIQTLIARANVQVGDILVADASRQSDHSNAYFTGFGPTRRVVLYDTLLEHHPPAEIQSILAHELGHWLHDHIVQGILLGGLAAIFGLLVLRSLLNWGVRQRLLGMDEPGDPRGLYFVLLLVWMGGWIAAPIEHAVSRHFEVQADRTSLELADRAAFIEAEKTLVRKNLGNVAPNRLNYLMFASHPTYLDRIRMAQDWRP